VGERHVAWSTARIAKGSLWSVVCVSLLVKGVQVDRLCSHSRWRATDRVDKRYQCTSDRYTSASIGGLRASTSPSRMRDPIQRDIGARQCFVRLTY
jgi:hypothetical protein